MAAQIFILGSCVTRDAFDFIAHDHTLVGYICRSSLGSGFAAEPFDLSLAQLDPKNEMVSAFQKRMVDIDLQKDTRRQIAGLGPEDIVIVDLIDERFQLLVYNGTLATHSAELQRVKPLEAYPQITVIKANTDQHFELWLQGLRRFAEQARTQGIRVVLNKVSWAEKDVLGVDFSLPYVRANNAHLQKMFTAFQEELNCAAIEYERPFLADPSHKWGQLPFHYEAGVYTEFMAKLNGILDA